MSRNPFEGHLQEVAPEEPEVDILLPLDVPPTAPAAAERAASFDPTVPPAIRERLQPKSPEQVLSAKRKERTELVNLCSLYIDLLKTIAGRLFVGGDVLISDEIVEKMNSIGRAFSSERVWVEQRVREGSVKLRIGELETEIAQLDGTIKDLENQVLAPTP